MGKPKKKDLLIDCDGVLADFSKGICDMQSYGDLTPAGVDRWEIFDLLHPMDKRLALNVLGDADWWKSLSVIEGAKEGFEALRRKHNIFIVTSPWNVGDKVAKGWDDARREWLRREFDVPYYDVYIARGKERIMGDLLIDDKPGNILAYQNAHGPQSALLFDQPYNRGLDLIRTTWEDLVRNYG